MAVERKYERDIDLLLAEEFAVNAEFAAGFRSLTGFGNRNAHVCDCWVSRSDVDGESDLIVVFEDSQQNRFALLIEDKIDAPLQPDQANRYRIRADRDILSGEYAEYEVLLCAPRYYLDNRMDLDGFDHLIAFEEIASILRGLDSARAEYRANYLETAGTRRVNSWSRRDDATTNQFWEAAYRMAERDFPQLEMKQPKFSEGSTWINFRPHDFPTRPRRIYVSFKGDRGYIDLTFSHTKAHVFHEAVADLLTPEMTVHQTGKSAAIRITTPGFDVTENLDEGMPKVRAAFEASARLIALYREARTTFDEAAENSAA